MAGQYGIPIYNSSATDALVTEVNYVYGMRGSGARYRFWAVWGAWFFRDSVAQQRVMPTGQLEEIDRAAYPTPGSPLQSLNGIYPLFENGAREIIAKGMVEGRSRGELVGAVESNIITATRWDNKCTPIPLRRGYDPTGLIKKRILEDQTAWASYLPLRLGLGLLVNGTIGSPTGTLTPKTYAQKSLFATDHPINPNDKRLKGKTFKNTLTLPANPTELGWAQVKDQILQIVGFDGVTIVHDNMVQPTIVVATHEQALYWLRFIGGEKAAAQIKLQPLVVNGVPVGVSSCSVGDATIIVEPYLLTVADDKTDILKRAFVHPNSGYSMEPLIMREEQTPITAVSQPTDYQGFENKVVEIVTDAIVGFGLGDPRGVFEVRTP